MNYVICGAAVRSTQGRGYEAWFWIDQPGEPAQHVYPRTRVGRALFPTIELAEAAGVAFGLERARGLLREKRI